MEYQVLKNSFRSFVVLWSNLHQIQYFSKKISLINELISKQNSQNPNLK